MNIPEEEVARWVLETAQRYADAFVASSSPRIVFPFGGTAEYGERLRAAIRERLAGANVELFVGNSLGRVVISEAKQSQTRPTISAAVSVPNVQSPRHHPLCPVNVGPVNAACDCPKVSETVYPSGMSDKAEMGKLFREGEPSPSVIVEVPTL